MALMVKAAIYLRQVDILEGHLEIPENVDCHSDPSHLPFGNGIVRVVPHLCREIEGDIEARLSVGYDQLEPLVRLVGRSETRILSRRPSSAL